MTHRQFTLCILLFITVIILFSIGAFVGIKHSQIELQKSIQVEVEKEKIINDTKLKRTQERMELIPWYNKNNKDNKDNIK